MCSYPGRNEKNGRKTLLLFFCLVNCLQWTFNLFLIFPCLGTWNLLSGWEFALFPAQQRHASTSTPEQTTVCCEAKLLTFCPAVPKMLTGSGTEHSAGISTALGGWCQGKAVGMPGFAGRWCVICKRPFSLFMAPRCKVPDRCFHVLFFT